MAEVFIAAAAEAQGQARSIAGALAALGYEAELLPPDQAELAKVVPGAKCVLALWTPQSATPPWLAAVAALALERNTLVCLELDGGAAPSMFHDAPRMELRRHDRAAFKAQFEMLNGAIAKLAPREQPPSPEALAAAVLHARSALAPPPRRTTRWQAAGAIALLACVVFAFGVGAGKLLQGVRSTALLVAAGPANAASSTPGRTIETAPLGLTAEDLESVPWRDAALRIDEDTAARIKAGASRGEPLAQTLSCLGHLAGARGFLPSPVAARRECDEASGQGYPPALYLSWALRRAAPQAAVDEATARSRLRAAAELGWLPAQLDYAQLLAGDFHTPLPDQTVAGQLWLAAAERGDPRAQYQYARWLRDSPAGPRDPAAAVPYLERAAERGQPEALHMLATLFRDGIGVARDPARARALYERAASRNHPPSMFNLAAMIERGTEADRARAAELYRGLACMRDERQIQPLAVQRLRAMGETPSPCS